MSQSLVQIARQLARKHDPPGNAISNRVRELHYDPKFPMQPSAFDGMFGMPRDATANRASYLQRMHDRLGFVPEPNALEQEQQREQQGMERELAARRPIDNERLSADINAALERLRREFQAGPAANANHAEILRHLHTAMTTWQDNRLLNGTVWLRTTEPGVQMNVERRQGGNPEWVFDVTRMRDAGGHGWQDMGGNTHVDLQWLVEQIYDITKQRVPNAVIVCVRFNTWYAEDYNPEIVHPDWYTMVLHNREEVRGKVEHFIRTRTKLDDGEKGYHSTLTKLDARFVMADVIEVPRHLRGEGGLLPWGLKEIKTRTTGLIWDDKVSDKVFSVWNPVKGATGDGLCLIKCLEQAIVLESKKEAERITQQERSTGNDAAAPLVLPIPPKNQMLKAVNETLYDKYAGNRRVTRQGLTPEEGREIAASLGVSVGALRCDNSELMWEYIHDGACPWVGKPVSIALLWIDAGAQIVEEEPPPEFVAMWEAERRRKGCGKRTCYRIFSPRPADLSRAGHYMLIHRGKQPFFHCDLCTGNFTNMDPSEHDCKRKRVTYVNGQLLRHQYRLATADLEAAKDHGENIPVMATTAWGLAEADCRGWINETDDVNDRTALANFFRFWVDKADAGERWCIFMHNLGRYDGLLLGEYLREHWPGKFEMNNPGGKIYNISINYGTVQFFDSLNFIKGSLGEITKQFNVPRALRSKDIVVDGKKVGNIWALLGSKPFAEQMAFYRNHSDQFFKYAINDSRSLFFICQKLDASLKDMSKRILACVPDSALGPMKKFNRTGLGLLDAGQTVGSYCLRLIKCFIRPHTPFATKETHDYPDPEFAPDATEAEREEIMAHFRSQFERPKKAGAAAAENEAAAEVEPEDEEEEEEGSDEPRAKRARRARRSGNWPDNPSMTVREFNLMARARIGGRTCYMTSADFEKITWRLLDVCSLYPAGFLFNFPCGTRQYIDHRYVPSSEKLGIFRLKGLRAPEGKAWKLIPGLNKDGTKDWNADYIEEIVLPNTTIDWIVEHGYTYEKVMEGFVWSHRANMFVAYMMEARKGKLEQDELKGSPHYNEAIRTLCKDCMNVPYGKMQQRDYSLEKNCVIIKDAAEAIALRRLGWYPTNTMRCMASGNCFYWLRRDPAMRSEDEIVPNGENIMHSSFLLSYAAMIREAYVQAVGSENVFYMDTDSLLIPMAAGERIRTLDHSTLNPVFLRCCEEANIDVRKFICFGDDLGNIKDECVKKDRVLPITRAIIVRKKLYALCRRRTIADMPPLYEDLDEDQLDARFAEWIAEKGKERTIDELPPNVRNETEAEKVARFDRWVAETGPMLRPQDLEPKEGETAEQHMARFREYIATGEPEKRVWDLKPIVDQETSSERRERFERWVAKLGRERRFEEMPLPTIKETPEEKQKRWEAYLEKHGEWLVMKKGSKGVSAKNLTDKQFIAHLEEALRDGVTEFLGQDGMDRANGKKGFMGVCDKTGTKAVAAPGMDDKRKKEVLLEQRKRKAEAEQWKADAESMAPALAEEIPDSLFVSEEGYDEDDYSELEARIERRKHELMPYPNINPTSATEFAMLNGRVWIPEIYDNDDDYTRRSQ